MAKMKRTEYGYKSSHSLGNPIPLHKQGTPSIPKKFEGRTGVNQGGFNEIRPVARGPVNHTDIKGYSRNPPPTPPGTTPTAPKNVFKPAHVASAFAGTRGIPKD